MVKYAVKIKLSNKTAEEELAKLPAVCTPTLIIQSAPATPSPPTDSVDLEQSSGWGCKPTIHDLANRMTMHTGNMLRELPIVASPIATLSPGIISVESMSPEPEAKEQDELADMLQEMQLSDATQKSPGPKRPRVE